MRFKLLLLVAVLAASLLLTTMALAYLTRYGGDLWWEYPDSRQGWAECEVVDLDDAKLMEALTVTRIGDGAVVFSDTVDTGVRGPEASGTGLAIADPWTLSVETDDLEPDAHRVTLCRWWQVYGSCDGGAVMTQTVCVVPLDDDGNPIPITDNDRCCWNADVVTGTNSIEIYLPLILRGWSAGPIRP